MTLSRRPVAVSIATSATLGLPTGSAFAPDKWPASGKLRALGVTAAKRVAKRATLIQSANLRLE